MSALRILVVGGFTRLDPYYRDAPPGVEIDAIYVDCPSLEARAAAVSRVRASIAAAYLAAKNRQRDALARSA